MNELAQKLQAPFPAEDYEWRVQRADKKEEYVIVVPYVTNRAVQNRMDEVFGPFGWGVSYEAGPVGGMMCSLSVYEPINKMWVTKSDGAENTDIESVKGGYSAACKRAGVVWGIGRLLYRLDAVKVPLKNNGKHYHKCKDSKYKYWDEPKLPDWAVAGGTEKSPAAQPKPAQKAQHEPTQKTQPEPQPATDGPTLEKIFWNEFALICNGMKPKLRHPKNVIGKAAMVEKLLSKLGTRISGLELDQPVPFTGMSADDKGWATLYVLVREMADDAPEVIIGATMEAIEDLGKKKAS